MTFDYPMIVVDDEKPTRLTIDANIKTTSPWARYYCVYFGW